MSERRSSPRVRTLKGGKILLNGRSSVIDCTVRNLSRTGALLRVESTVGVPDEFILRVEPEGIERACRVVRRQPAMLGVAFEGDG